MGANFWQFTFCFQFFIFDLVIVQTKMRNVVQLLRLFVCQFAITFHAFSSMSLHVVGTRWSFRASFVPSWSFLGCSNKNMGFEHLVVLSDNFLVGFAFPLDTSFVIVIKKWCWFLNVNVFHQCLPHKSKILFSDQFWYHPHRPIGITFASCERISIHNLGLFPNQVPSMLLRTVFPTIVLRMGVRINFVKEEQRNPQCIPMTSAIYVLENVPIHLDILIWFIFTWVYADIASAACPSRSGGRTITSIICGCHLWCWCALLNKYCISCRVIYHGVSSKQNSSFVLLELCLQLWIHWMTQIHHWNKVNFNGVFCVSFMTSFLLLTFLTPLSFPCPLLPLHLESSLLEASK